YRHSRQSHCDQTLRPCFPASAPKVSRGNNLRLVHGPSGKSIISSKAETKSRRKQLGKLRHRREGRRLSEREVSESNLLTYRIRKTIRDALKLRSTRQ